MAAAGRQRGHPDARHPLRRGLALTAEVQAAGGFSTAELAAVFNRGFSDYLVPLALDEEAMREHIAVNDIDLDWSQVAVDSQPVALALIAHRGPEAWVGGMGTAPSHRRRGLGERALVAGLDVARAHGCDSARLEVIAGNDRALGLYEKVGFATERMLVVWSLDARPASALIDVGGPPQPGQTLAPIEPAAAQSWIAAHRGGHEPWQRADASLERMRQGGAELEALAVQRDTQTVAAIVYRARPAGVTVLQVAASDDDAALAALGAAASGRALRLSNLPADSALTPVLERLGAEPMVRQHEMQLAL